MEIPVHSTNAVKLLIFRCTVLGAIFNLLDISSVDASPTLDKNSKIPFWVSDSFAGLVANSPTLGKLIIKLPPASLNTGSLIPASLHNLTIRFVPVPHC